MMILNETAAVPPQGRQDMRERDPLCFANANSDFDNISGRTGRHHVADLSRSAANWFGLMDDDPDVARVANGVQVRGWGKGGSWILA